MPDPITFGHALMLAGVLIGLYGLVRLGLALARRSRPGGGDGGRHGLIALVAGALLYAVGCFTPVGEIALR